VVKILKIEEESGSGIILIPEVIESMVGPPAELYVRLAAFLYLGETALRVKNVRRDKNLMRF